MNQTNHPAVKIMAICESFLQENIAQLSDFSSFRPHSFEEVFKINQDALAIGADREAQVYFVRNNPQIAFIPVIGATSKFGGWTSMGMVQLGEMLDRAQSSGKYKAAMIYIDSPGGTVDGTQDWGNQLMNAKIPTLAFIDGYGTSAAYWQAVSTNMVLANSQNMNIIGSIGVQTLHVDAREAMKSKVGEVTVLRAKQSTLKNTANPYEELSKEAKEQIIDMLSESAEGFINHVQSRMPGIDAKSDVFKGQVYNTAQALELGLIHGTATFDEAVSTLTGMIPSASNIKAKTNPNPSNMKFSLSMTAILAALGFANAKVEEEAPQVTEERLTALDASLTAANATISAKEEEIVKLKADLSTANASLATVTTERDNFKADAEKYGKQAGANHNAPKKDKPEGGNAELTEEEKAAAIIASLPHNAALNGNPMFNHSTPQK